MVSAIELLVRRACVVVLSACAVLAGGASAQNSPAPVPLSVIAFDGGWNIPLWAAQRQGYFEANGVTVRLNYTPNSGYLIDALVEGRVDIGFALFDNLVAYQEGQGETGATGKPDLVAIMGGDGGFLSLVAAPGIERFSELKGRTASVDAMTTGAAFVLRELVARNAIANADIKYERVGGTADRYRDLIAGKHDATMLRTPFESLAASRGFHVLGTAEALGAYQGTVGMVRRSWSLAHEAVLIGFLRAYRAGLDFVCDTSNRTIVEALLVANIRDMTPALARQSYDLLLTANGGLTRDLAVDSDGIRTVLSLRSKYGTPSKLLSDPSQYLDSTYLRKAFGQ